MTPPKRGKFPKNIPYHDVFMGTLPSSRRGKCVTLFGGMYLLRRLMQGDEAHPKTILANNFRPPQPLYNRSVRTNVYNHDRENSSLNYCSLQGIEGYSNASAPAVMFVHGAVIANVRKAVKLY
ncbi:hypothetical protein TNCV_3556851 [Trichonephila clavipes]|uniref:Uncharacterized protein n=1 Tax=Trichonephila clavipes TaxID=2585209 RepID=A0A8X7BJ00_TRICX|nr:hypothetical protein TNCV_3556851 [Trichonephila clavipes]